MKKIKFHSIDQNSFSFIPKPVPSNNLIPEWYKQQESFFEKDKNLAYGNSGATIKKCMPVFDAMTAGYLLRFPCDVFIDATDQSHLKYSMPQEIKDFLPDLFRGHNQKQYDKYPIDNNIYHKQVFRINPYWAIETEEGSSTLFLHPLHRDDLPFFSFSAIIDTDKFASYGGFSMLIKKDFKGIIKEGTPFIQAIPIKRDKWKMEFSNTENSKAILSKQHMNLRTKFINGYKDKFRTIKEFK